MIDQGSSNALRSPASQAFEEQHYPVSYWASRWGFSKTVRDVSATNRSRNIRQPHTGRRSKRNYTTIMISTSAAARVYAKRTMKELVH